MVTCFDKYLELMKCFKTKKNECRIWEKELESFSEVLADFCINSDIFSVYRIIRKIENDLSMKMKYSHFGYKDSDCSLYVEQLSNMIQVEKEIILFKMENPSLNERFSTHPLIPKLLKWTDTKIALVEMIYGCSGSVNNGNASIKEIRDCLEFIFQIKLGNYCYDGIEDILLRKNKPARYLLTMIENLERHLDRIVNKSYQD